MTPKIEKLLYQRYILHTKKVALLQELDIKSYVRSAPTLHALHSLISKEIHMNRKLSILLKKTSFPEDIEKEFVRPVYSRLAHINSILEKESFVLCRTNVFTYSYSVLQKLFTGKQKHFTRRLKTFKTLADKELALHDLFFTLSQKMPQVYQIPEKKVQNSWQLVSELQKELRKLGQVLGDTALVKKQGEYVLVLISQVQKAEIYEFVKEDVLYVKTKVEYIMAHPKENKLAYFLTTVYIVAPGTFEMTGVILFFRYLGKYTLSQTKKLKGRFSKV